MEIDQAIHNEALSIAISGEVDASSSLKLDEAIKGALAKEHYKILINCQNLEYISSAGLGVFISHMEDVNQNQGAIVFHSMSESVYEVFKLLGLHQIMNIFSSESESLQFLNEV